MNNYTTDLYEVKRGITNFSKKLTQCLGQVESKFINEMFYGINKNQSCIVSDISDALEEDMMLVYKYGHIKLDLLKLSK
jgi:hypothetical protein